jgi:hypothetical protein
LGLLIYVGIIIIPVLVAKWWQEALEYEVLKVTDYKNSLKPTI